MTSLEYILHTREERGDFDAAFAWIFVDRFTDVTEQCRRLVESKLAILLVTTQEYFNNHAWALGPPSWQVASLTGFGEQPCLGIKVVVEGDISLEDEWYLVYVLRLVTSNVVSLHDVTVLFWDNDGDFVGSVLLVDYPGREDEASRYDLPTSLYLRRGIIRRFTSLREPLHRLLFRLPTLWPTSQKMEDYTLEMQKRLDVRLEPFQKKQGQYFGNITLGALVPMPMARLLQKVPHLAEYLVGIYLGGPKTVSGKVNEVVRECLDKDVPKVLMGVKISLTQSAQLASCKARRMPSSFLLRNWGAEGMPPETSDEDLKSFKLVGSRITFALNELLLSSTFPTHQLEGVLMYSHLDAVEALVDYELSKKASIVESDYIKKLCEGLLMEELEMARIQDKLSLKTLRTGYAQYRAVKIMLKMTGGDIITNMLRGHWIDKGEDIKHESNVKALSSMDFTGAGIDDFLRIISGGDSNGIRRIMGFPNGGADDEDIGKELMEQFTKGSSNIFDGLEFHPPSANDVNSMKEEFNALIRDFKEFGIDEQDLNELTSSNEDHEGDDDDDTEDDQSDRQLTSHHGEYTERNQANQDALQALQDIELEENLEGGLNSDTEGIVRNMVESITSEATNSNLGPASLLISEIRKS